jgi:oligopeptide transport system substrate-binding protein
MAIDWSNDRLRGLALPALAALLVGTTALLTARTSAPRADFAFCNQTEISSLDPAISSGVPDARILRALFEGLTRPDPATCEPRPGAALRWEESADGLSWRFFLRPDGRWSNGDAVTAEDFVYSLGRVLHPGTASRYAYLLWCIEGAEAFTQAPLSPPPDPRGLGLIAVGEHELLIRLVRRTPYLPSLLSYAVFVPVHRPSVEAHGTSWVKPEHLVSNGPFHIVSRRIRDHIRLERSMTYWGVEEVGLSSIMVYAANGITTQLNMYLTGQVDWMVKPPPGLYDALRERSDLKVGGQLGTTFLRFNTHGGPFADGPRDSPFRDPRVRRALTLALDRESLARDVMRGGEVAMTSFVPAGLPSYEPAVLAPADLDLAKQLLAEAGYPDGQGFPIFTLLYPHNEVTRDFCDAVATRWRRTLGIHAELVNQVFGVYLDSSVAGLYDTAWGAWIGDYLDPSTFLEIFLSNSGNNRTGWGSPAYDQLVEQAGGEPDSARRAALYREAEAILLDELPIAPIYQRMNINLVSERVTGWHDNLLDVHPLRDIALRSGRVPDGPGDTTQQPATVAPRSGDR